MDKYVTASPAMASFTSGLFQILIIVALIFLVLFLFEKWRGLRVGREREERRGPPPRMKGWEKWDAPDGRD